MDRFFSSRVGLILGLALARIIPPWLGYKITNGIGKLISMQKGSEMVGSARLNQWVISGCTLKGEKLNNTVDDHFKYHARAIYDLYHYLQDLENAGKLFHIEPAFKSLIDRPQFEQRGLVAAGLHMIGFDLAFQWLCPSQMEPLCLTIPNPQGARLMEFQRRLSSGMNLVPGTMEGMRQALHYLKRGGMVLTGLDHPQEENQLQPKFFGHISCLPIHTVFLAIKSKTPIVLAASRLNKDGTYTLSASDPIEMDPYPDRNISLLRNAEKVLSVAEDFIKKAPAQWLISKPVWLNLKFEAN
jgi:lauroyl/myristoyl acyltransferase